MKVPDDLQSQMVSRTDEQLLSMFQRPEDWLPEALKAAQAELRRRNIDLEPVRPEVSASEAQDLRVKPPEEAGGINYRQQAHIGIPFGYTLQLLCGVIMKTEKTPEMFYGAELLGFMGVGLLIWGCAGYAEGKGYSKWLGALGVLSCIGLLVLILLPDRRAGYDDHTS